MKLIAFFNDDCILHRNDLDELIEFLERSPFIGEIFLEYSSTELEMIDFQEDEK